MLITDLSGEQLMLLLLPALPNLWGLRHAMYHDFANPKEKTRWMLACVFLPCIGGLAYLAAGRKRALDSAADASARDESISAITDTESETHGADSLESDRAERVVTPAVHSPREWDFGCPDDVDRKN